MSTGLPLANFSMVSRCQSTISGHAASNACCCSGVRYQYQGCRASTVNGAKMPSRGASMLAHGVGGLAATRYLAVAVVAMTLFGASYVTVVSMNHSAIQRLASDDNRGRITSLWMMTFGICFPLGVLAQGAVAEVLGVRTALALVAGLLAVVLVYLSARHVLGRIDPPVSAAPVPR